MSAAWLEVAPPSHRFGLKGPRAAALLAELGVDVPAAPNHWSPLAPGAADESVVARLGNTEFLVDERGDGAICAALAARCAVGVPGAYAVLREDTALQLGGSAAADVLAEVCNVDFRPVPAGRPVYLTLMIGVGVLVLPQTRGAGRIFRIWCDPTFGPYLQEALETVVHRIQPGKAHE